MGRPKNSKNGIRTVRTKQCELCNKKFVANYANFSKVRFCSYSCSNSLKKGRLGKIGSEIQKQVMKSRVGEKHPRWIKDRNNLIGRHTRNFHDPEYKQWRHAVKKRDGFVCRLSNQDCKGGLEVHHIHTWKSNSELRYTVSNGITLCHYHHPRTRKSEIEMMPILNNLISPERI